MKLLKNYNVWIGVLFLICIILLRITGVGDYFNLGTVQDKRERLQLFVQTNYWHAVIIFMLLYMLEVVLVLPFSALLTLISGFLFGLFPGTLFSALSATVGATLFFIIIRSSLGAAIQERYRDRLKGFNKNIEKYGISYLIAMRLFVFLPFFIQNIAIGLTKVPISLYVATTLIGVLPASFVYAYAGQQLATISSVQDVFSGPVLMAFILIMILGLIPVIVQRKLNHTEDSI